MSKITKYALSDLYDMSSGLSSKKEQAGHGAPFVSFGTVFNNYFLPEELPDLMDTNEKEQQTYSIKAGDVLITRTSETIDELAMSCVAVKDYPKATYSGFTKRLRPKREGIAYPKYMAFYFRSELFRKAVTNNAFMTLRASFNEDIFTFLDVYLPIYEEQVRIGDMLYAVECKIQKNKEINAMSIVDLENKTILVTGAAGFIGSNLVKRIYQEAPSATVIGIDNMNAYYDVALKEFRLNELAKYPTFTFIKGNIADKALITELFEKYKPSVVVNLAAQAGVRYSITNPDAYVESNLVGFFNILHR